MVNFKILFRGSLCQKIINVVATAITVLSNYYYESNTK